MSENEKNIIVFFPDGSGKTIVVKSGVKGLTDWERVKAMTEEEIDHNARSDPDALPIEEDTMWERGTIVYPETSSEMPI
jgi:hypothetical protein